MDRLRLQVLSVLFGLSVGNGSSYQFMAGRLYMLCRFLCFV